MHYAVNRFLTLDYKPHLETVHLRTVGVVTPVESPGYVLGRFTSAISVNDSHGPALLLTLRQQPEGLAWTYDEIRQCVHLHMK